MHAVLFTMDGCLPCKETKDFADALLEQHGEYYDYISFMKAENHSALVETYKLGLYPTLLIVGPSGHEVERVIGGVKVRLVLEDKLKEIREELLKCS